MIRFPFSLTRNFLAAGEGPGLDVCGAALRVFGDEGQKHFNHKPNWREREGVPPEIQYVGA